MLNFHSISTNNKNEISVFDDCKNRILTMAKVHHFFYSKGDLANIQIDEYIEEISTDIFNSYNLNIDLRVNYNLDKVKLSIENAIPHGLILNEILVNAIKHAFPNGKGIIDLKLIQKDKEIIFSVCDNGKGFEISNSKQKLGFELINTLIDQLNGKLKLESNENGTCYEILF